MRINYLAPLNKTGYGVAAAGYAAGLLMNGVDFSYTIIGGTDLEDPDLKKQNHLLEKVAQTPDWNDPTFCFWHLHDIPNQITQVTGLIQGMTTFETDTLSKPEIEATKKLRSISTASNWGFDLLCKYFPDKRTYRIPHALKYWDKDVLPVVKYDPSSSLDSWRRLVEPTQLSDETFVITSGGKFEKRKSHSELIDAALKLSTKRQVLLVGFWYNPFLHDGYPFAEFHARGMYPEYTKSGIKLFRKGNLLVAIMPPTPSRQELHSALTKSNIFISPSKGEGWDLPLFEIMSFGMPCIATLNTAHLDYCTASNVIPIDTPKLVPAFDGKFFHGTSNWYEVTSEQIYIALDEASSMATDQLASIGMLGRAATEEYSWQRSGKIIQTIANI